MLVTGQAIAAESNQEDSAVAFVVRDFPPSWPQLDLLHHLRHTQCRNPLLLRTSHCRPHHWPRDWRVVVVVAAAVRSIP